jgi:hypothetical protein
MHPDHNTAEAWAHARLRAAGHAADVSDYVDRFDIIEILLTLVVLYCLELLDR